MSASSRFYQWQKDLEQEAWDLLVKELHNKINEVMVDLEKEGMVDRILEAVEEAKNSRATVIPYVRKK